MSYSVFQKKVVGRIRQMRTSGNLTQEDMEEGKYGINLRTYQRIERMETDITMNNLYRISRRLDVDIRSFFDFD